MYLKNFSIKQLLIPLLKFIAAALLAILFVKLIYDLCAVEAVFTSSFYLFAIIIAALFIFFILLYLLLSKIFGTVEFVMVRKMIMDGSVKFRK
jgi:hypothetical protein